MFNYMEVMNQETGHMKIVDELSDTLFDTGYRFNRYVPNREVDLLELDAIAEEERLATMELSASDPCYWVEDKDSASDPIYRQALEIY